MSCFAPLPPSQPTTDADSKMSDPSFWRAEVLEDITIRVPLDPRVVTWASLVDSRELKRLGFTSDTKYTLPMQREIEEKLTEVVDAVDEEGYLNSVYTQHGKPFDFYASKGRIANLTACIRSMFLRDFKELDVSSAAHRIHELVTKRFRPQTWAVEKRFFQDLKDKRTRQRLACELKVTAEEAKEHLNSIWNSFEERKGVHSDDFKTFERTAWRIRKELLDVPELRFIRDIAFEDHKGDPKRIEGSFMSRVYAFVMNKVLMAVRDKLGATVVMSLVHDSCHVRSEQSDVALIRAAEEASVALVGDRLCWLVKPPDYRIKIGGTKKFTDIDISERIDLDSFEEETLLNMESVDIVATHDFVDPKQMAVDLGHNLTQLHRAKMKKTVREERIQDLMHRVLTKMNVRYKLVDDCYIDTQIEHPKQGFKMIALNKFRATLKCTTVEYVSGGKSKSTVRFNLAAMFEDWNKQERYEKLCFHPKETPPRSFNTFTPFDAAQMEPLRKEQRNAIGHRLVRLFNHIKYLSGERPYDFMMLILWVANMLQHPEAKSLCLVLMSAEGVGKSMFTRLLQRIIGKTKTLRTSSPENNVWGRFNSPMIGKFLVELAEISKANMHHQYEKVLNILEDDEFQVECKGVDGMPLESLHHFILNSNNMAAVPPGRRFLPMYCSDRYAANVDCRHCAKRMLDTEGEELMCHACLELGDYHAENHKAFDDLCAKAFFEFSMALEGVPEKLTSTHVRENKATAHIKEASKDIIDNFLEHWVSTRFAEYFKECPDSLEETVYIDPASLHLAYKQFVGNDKEVLDEPSFKNRLGRKKLTGMVKKRVRIEGSTYQPHRYVVAVRKLIQELDIAGETCGAKSIVDERSELNDALEVAKAEREGMEQALKGKLETVEDRQRMKQCNDKIAIIEAQLDELRRTEAQRFDKEIVEEEHIAAGNFVPKAWRAFYDDPEARVSAFLDEHLGRGRG